MRWIRARILTNQSTLFGKRHIFVSISSYY